MRGGNLCSEFGHATPSGSPVILYVRDGQTDERTKPTLTAPFPTGGGISRIEYVATIHSLTDCCA